MLIKQGLLFYFSFGVFLLLSFMLLRFWAMFVTLFSFGVFLLLSFENGILLSFSLIINYKYSGRVRTCTH
jgi:hypothetical protein